MNRERLGETFQKVGEIARNTKGVLLLTHLFAQSMREEREPIATALSYAYEGLFVVTPLVIAAKAISEGRVGE